MLKFMTKNLLIIVYTIRFLPKCVFQNTAQFQLVVQIIVKLRGLGLGFIFVMHIGKYGLWQFVAFAQVEQKGFAQQSGALTLEQIDQKLFILLHKSQQLSWFNPYMTKTAFCTRLAISCRKKIFSGKLMRLMGIFTIILFFTLVSKKLWTQKCFRFVSMNIGSVLSSMASSNSEIFAWQEFIWFYFLRNRIY